MNFLPDSIEDFPIRKQPSEAKIPFRPRRKLGETAQPDCDFDSDNSDYEYTDDCTPGPGSYYPENVVRAIRPLPKISKIYSNFGSTNERFKSKKPATTPIEAIGVGDKPRQHNRILSLNVKKPAFMSSNSRFEMKNIEEVKPGPG